MVFLCEQLSRGRQEDLHEVWHLGDDAERTQRRLLPDVGVGGFDEALDLAGQIAGHFWRGDCTQSAQRQTHHELGTAVQVTVKGAGGGGAGSGIVISLQNLHGRTHGFHMDDASIPIS